MGDINESLLLKNNGVELGAEFDNLFFENNPTPSLFRQIN